MVSNICSILGDYQTWQQFHALSFYRYKKFWMRPNWFGVGKVQNRVQIVLELDRSKMFWTRPKTTFNYWISHFESPEPKIFGSAQNSLDVSYALTFYRSQNVLGWSKIFVPDKNVFTYCDSHKHFVPHKKMICIQ